MTDIDLGEVGFVSCVICDKQGRIMDAVVIKPIHKQASMSLPQRVVRAIVKLVNTRRRNTANKDESEQS